MQKYRQHASFYDVQAKELIINRLTMRGFYIINHLRETNMKDEKGNDFQLKIDPKTNNLSVESLTELYNTVPALMDVVMTLFERKLLVMFQMNQ